MAILIPEYLQQVGREYCGLALQMEVQYAGQRDVFSLGTWICPHLLECMENDQEQETSFVPASNSKLYKIKISFLKHWAHLCCNSYLKKLSPRSLKVEGSSKDQPSEIFSLAWGTNNPARGRTKYLLEEPAFRYSTLTVILDILVPCKIIKHVWAKFTYFSSLFSIKRLPL